jgi:uncharacterized protein
MASDGDARDTAVNASPAALEVIKDISAGHGPLMFFQSAGCCDGGSLICLQEGELPLGPDDVLLGEIGGAPVYMDAQQYESWGRPHLTIEVSPGAADGFSLEGVAGVHFTTRSRPNPE